jgi:hypothetical protein
MGGWDGVAIRHFICEVLEGLRKEKLSVYDS